MKINLLAIGKRMPAWVQQGFEDYSKRLPSQFQLHLLEIEAKKRSKNADLSRITTEEGQALLNAVPDHSLIIALDEHGKQWDTQEFAQNLQKWHDEPQNISFLVGGADGLAQECLKKAHITLSLSRLTFPHPLVRVIIAEQIYRAVSLLQGHPYHRA